jgi:hypothetical protein
MNVTFRSFGPQLASTRLRSIIPAQQLYALGVGTGTDWLIIGKHNWNFDEQREGFKKVCFDICDDWFDSEVKGPHYREVCEKADLVTCNSLVMQQIIKHETGRDAVFIPDPYEQPVKPARVSNRLLWFGFRTNLVYLHPLLPSLNRCPLQIVSNIDNQLVTPWSPEAMDEAFDDAGLVIIPTGKSMAKSANRAIDSLRRGIYPICGNLPAYSDLGVWQGDIVQGIEWALSHQDEVMRRIKSAQHYIRYEYSPQRIGKLWLKALS